MPNLNPLEPGVIFWAGKDRLADIQALGVRCGQMAIPGDMPLDAAAAAQWKSDLAAANFTLVTVFATYTGEDYADIPTVKRTVGFIPQGTRESRERRTLEVSDFAAALGVGSVACHVGFVPEDANDPDYIGVRDLVRRICDHAAKHGQTFAMETGQERAEVLLGLLRDVDRANLKINFDPANLILYGSEEPIPALRTLAPYVVSVHAKDGDWPEPTPGALGKERPLGKGSVGMENFVSALKEVGFQGPLNVEREVEDQAERYRDLAAGISLVRSLVGA